MALQKTDNTRKYVLKNVLEAFTIIAKLLDANMSFGLTQLSNCTHFTKNKTFRLLLTLERCGIVEKDLQDNYRIGHAAIEIARKIMASSLLLNSARPFMEELVKTVNEAVYFAHCKNGEAVLMDYVDCSQPVKAASFVGKAFHHHGSTKLVISGNSVVKTGDITVDVDNLGLDITTVFMPFYDNREFEMGALVVVAPTYRMSQNRIKTDIVPALRVVMQRESLSLPKITDEVLFSSCQAT